MNESSVGKGRYILIAALLILAAGGMALRLAMLLKGDNGQIAQRVMRQQRMVLPLPARTGSIFARTRHMYVPLAVSRQVPSAYADPYIIEDNQLDEVAISVGNALEMSPLEVQEILLRRREGRFVWLKRQLSEEQARRLEALKLPAVRITHEWRREYPNHELGATVVGFRRIDDEPGAGLELAKQPYLAAQSGKRVVLADARRRAIWPLSAESVTPSDGNSVMLSLDAVIQGYLQQAIQESLDKYGGKWGTGIVVEPQSGRILAMCSLPTYDPNEYSTASLENQTNHAIVSPYEPGSVFKPLITAGAVDAGILSYETKIDCENGTYNAPRGGRISDHGHSYGVISVAEGVVVSSNICMAKIGEKLGNDQIHEMVRRFGFGQPTGIELPGETGGIVRPLNRWDGYSLRRVPFGQEISASTIQLAMAFSVLANGGLLMKPSLVDEIYDAEGNLLYQAQPEVVRRVISPQVARQTLDVMQQVVERGTGKNCIMKQWTSFGKTGTAQIAGPGGYVDRAYVGSFVGGAPVGEPRLVCLISIYWPNYSKGYYGSTVSAPYVKKVLERSLEYLGVPPDKRDTKPAKPESGRRSFN